MPATSQPKSITTHDGQTFTLDFYCDRRLAYMTYIGCERMQAAARKAKELPPRKFEVGPIDESPCLHCDAGRAIADRNHRRKNPGRNCCDKPRTRCLWPGCKELTHASGLCQKHSRALKRNALIKINTAAAGPSAIRDFLEKLLEMAADAALPLEDVALAAMDEGLKVYFERKQRCSPRACRHTGDLHDARPARTGKVGERGAEPG